MAWTTPRGWSAGETETAGIFNLHLRDQLNVIRTPMDVGGPSTTSARVVLGGAGRGYGASVIVGQNSNPSGAVDTALSGCALTIPPGTWYNYGDALILETAGAFAANANTKVIKIRLGAATPVTILTGTPNALNWWSRHILLLNSSTNVGLYGPFHYGDASLGGAVTTLVCNGSFTLPSVLTNPTPFDILVNSSGASDIILSEWSLSYALSLTGALV